MTTRTEKVVLTADVSGFTTGMAKAAVSAAALEKYLNSLDGNSVSLGNGLQRTSREIDGVGTSSRTAGADIDKFSGRLRLMGEAAAVLGPALIPLGGVAIAGVAGLASQLGFAATGLTSLVVASQGVGDALGAMEKARLEPTVANIEAAQQAMSLIGPDAQAFVTRFQELRPVLSDIRDAAAAGWFPGLTDSLDSLDVLAPRVASILEAVGRAGGDLVAEGAQALTGGEWQEFFSFVEREAPAAMEQLGRTVGNVASGFADLWMAFAPLNQNFGDFLVDASRGFADWADGLSQTQGFQDFVDYIQTNGPKLAEFGAALADAFIQIIEAAAPLGGPVLEALTAVANVISAIADSDLGTPIFAAVAAFSALNRVLAITQRLGATPAAGLLGMGGAAGAKSQGSIAGMVTALGTVTSAQDRARLSAAQLAAVEKEKAAAIRGGLASIGKSAALIGGLTVATTGAADGIGLTNTASLALMGSLGGLPGVVGGAVVGAFLDFKGATDDAVDGIQRLNTAMGSLSVGSFDQLSASTQGSVDQLSGFANLLDNDVLRTVAAVPSYIGSLFGDPSEEVDKMQQALDLTRNRADALETGLTSLATTMGGDLATAAQDGALSTSQLEEVVANTAPALDKLGLSTQQFSDALIAAEGGDPMYAAIFGQSPESVINAVQRTSEEMDTAAGRSEALGAAFTSMSGGALTAAQRAQLFGSAMGAIVGPQLAAMSTTDQLTYATRHLGEALAKNSKTLEGNSDAAIQNRTAFGQQIDLMSQAAEAALAADVPLRKVQRDMLDQSKALIRAGEAAGVNRQQMLRLLKTYEMTPKQIRTQIEARGAQEANLTVGRLRRSFETLPKDVRTAVRAEGIPRTIGEVNGLVNKYELSEKERQALITLKDAASAGIRNIIGLISGVNSKTVTITTIMRTVYQRGGDAQRDNLPMPGVNSADGGSVPKTGRGYADRHPYLLADGEEVISNRFGQADRHRGLLKAINSNRLAMGGTASALASQFSRSINTPRPQPQRLVGASFGSRGGTQVIEHRVVVTGELDSSRAVTVLRQQMHDVAQDNFDANRDWEEGHGRG